MGALLGKNQGYTHRKLGIYSTENVNAFFKVLETETFKKKLI